MSSDFTLYDFQPLCITLEGVGPFNEPYEIKFTDADDTPCNFYLMVAANGFGKTTVLETMTALMGVIGEEDPREIGQDDLDSGRGRAQMDVLVRAYWHGAEHKFVLSIFAGRLTEELSLKPWGEDLLEPQQATQWLRCGFERRGPGRLRPFSSHRTEGFVADLLAALAVGRLQSPSGFEQGLYHLPTALYFSAYRDIPPIRPEIPGVLHQLLEAAGIWMPSERRFVTQPDHWRYRTVHRFLPHNQHWTYSLDNLLVWLRWLDDGRFERARDIINQRVFKDGAKTLVDVSRDPPEAVVRCGEDDDACHRLDRLSSGEKNLVQLFLRIGAHMTRNTILLIDEFDVHLHIRWQYRLLNALKGLAGDQAGVTVIATTHSAEILDTYVNSMGIIEQGSERRLVKGGHLIENVR
jgi:hypothetical protein